MTRVELNGLDLSGLSEELMSLLEKASLKAILTEQEFFRLKELFSSEANFKYEAFQVTKKQKIPSLEKLKSLDENDLLICYSVINEKLYKIIEFISKEQLLNLEKEPMMSNYVMNDNWESTDTTNSNILFKPQEGENKIRVVSGKFDHISHWVKTAGVNKKKEYRCLGIKECLLCQHNFTKSIRKCFFIIDRKDQKIKLYEAPNEVYKYIASFNDAAELGDPRYYDIKIHKTGTGLNTKYQVIPTTDKSQLTLEELEAVSNVISTFDPDKKYPKPTKEQLNDLLQVIDQQWFEMEEKVKASRQGLPAPFLPERMPTKVKQDFADILENFTEELDKNWI